MFIFRNVMTYIKLKLYLWMQMMLNVKCSHRSIYTSFPFCRYSVGNRSTSQFKWLSEFHVMWDLRRRNWHLRVLLLSLPILLPQTAAYLSLHIKYLIRHGPHRKHRDQEFVNCCVHILCPGKVFNEPLLRNLRGTHTQQSEFAVFLLLFRNKNVVSNLH